MTVRGRPEQYEVLRSFGSAVTPQRITVALLVVLPVTVGVAAGAILDVLADRQQIARDARLAVAQLHGTVQLQEALVDHAMVMDHLTEDLPGRLEALRLEGEDQLQTYRELVSPNATVGRLEGAWTSYVDSVDRRMSHLGDDAHEPSMDAAEMSQQDMVSPPAPSASAGQPHPGPASTPEARRLLGLIGEVDETLRRQVLQASEIADRGTIATVVLAALILAVVFWQAARTRRAAALAEANRRSEARFRSLVQNASDVIVVVEPDTTIVYHSPSAERMLRGVGKGHTRPRLVDVVHQDERTATHTSVSMRAPSRTCQHG